MGVRFRARRRAVNDVVDRAARWATNQPDVTSLVVVGSYAAGRARMGSDLDLVILSERVEEHLGDLGFVQGIAPGGRVVRCEQWGPMYERRVRLRTRLLVEFGVSTPAWAVLRRGYGQGSLGRLQDRRRRRHDQRGARVDRTPGRGMAASHIAGVGRAPGGRELGIAWLPPRRHTGSMRRVLPTTVPRLEHPRVVLRPFEDEDRDVVASVASDTLIPLITTVPASGRAEEVAAYIQRQRDRLSEGVGYSFAIADSVTDEAVGQIGLWTRAAHLGRASIGYWVAPQFRRRGYARAALATVTEWASTLGGIHRLQLFVEPWNEGSWRAAEACGYHREGLLRSWERVGDEYRDMYAYSRLTTEGRPTLA